jgi:capsular polysaccharide biosynthesis protein
MENEPEIQEYEIGIREYIKVMIKRKKIILAVFLVSVIAAVILNLRMPNVYEITATIELGSVKELLIKNEEAKAVMLNQNLLQSVIKELDLKMGVDSLKKAVKITDLAGTNLLTIKITYPDIDLALKINDAIINPFLTKGQIIYQERLAIVNERLKELDSEIKNVERDISRTQALISGLPNANNISHSDTSLRVILLQNSLPNYESILNALRNQKNELRLVFSNAKDFKISEKPTMPKNPVGPKRTLNVFIAGMFSLIFGVFLVFILEFFAETIK